MTTNQWQSIEQKWLIPHTEIEMIADNYHITLRTQQSKGALVMVVYVNGGISRRDLFREYGKPFTAIARRFYNRISPTEASPIWTSFKKFRRQMNKQNTLITIKQNTHGNNH